MAAALPELVGGSADLTHSNLTSWPASQAVRAGAGGNYISYGVREFGMTAVMMRMSALMGLRVIHVYTHDSIALGEDGPTHQPIEHLASLRLIPNLEVWRPCDAYETAIAWREAIGRRAGPSALVLSRQGLPAMARDDSICAGVALGGYRLRTEAAPLALVLAATGSEVALAMDAAVVLERAGIGVRVVSLPCVERFMAQPAPYREAVLPRTVPALGVEAGHPLGLAGVLGCGAEVHGIAGFGESAPGPELMKHFGFTVEAVLAHAHRLLAPCQL